MSYYGLSVLLGAASYGVLSAFAVNAYDKGYSLGEVVGTQLILGSLLCWGWVLLRKMVRTRRLKGDPAKLAADKAAHALTWKMRGTLLACGLPTMFTSLLYNEALHHISASLAIILMFQFTWIGVLIESAMTRRKPGAIVYVTLAVLLGGTALAAGLTEKGIGEFSRFGLILGLLSAVSYSLFILVSGKAVVAAPPAARTAWMTTGSMIGVLLIHPPVHLFNGNVTVELLGYALALGLFGSFIPPVLFAIGVPRIGNGMAGILGSVELPVAVAVSAIVLREKISLLQWGGVAIVLIGVAIPELSRRLARERTGMTASGNG
ncbi:EamA family transporter [Cohnella thailandensis]|uniref:DMT family transporter n=1 Tax=Cohnella thailandensis TaxID=557557 RepID=A0A841T1N3_9BACL|nr:DMT family transporter [Cohnella thailandensis]MBB6636959.1 DMT family transporter [Cohnella thailandensis]MBP1973158.1 drug/metabolite transporter (DMT)-like permease [Cohnella thailandensis]